MFLFTAGSNVSFVTTGPRHTVRRAAAVLAGRSARIDRRTGVLTHDAWCARAQVVLMRARHDRTGCAVLFLDIDAFTTVNDTHGHSAGDSVLAAVSAVVRRATRATDIVGRFGGDEIVVLLPGLADRATGAVRQIGERIRRGVAELSVLADTPGGSVRITGLSVSIGGALAGGSPTARDVTALIWAADRAMYAAKKSGGNAVHINEFSGAPVVDDGARA